MMKRWSRRPVLLALVIVMLVPGSFAFAEVGDGGTTFDDDGVVDNCGTGMGSGGPNDQGDPDDYDLEMKGSLNIAIANTEFVLIQFSAWLSIL